MKQLLFSILILLGCALMVSALGTKEKDPPRMMMDSPDAAEGGVMMSDDSPLKIGGKISFTDMDTARALAAKGPVVLFFYADWCPTCQIAMKNIDENGKKLGVITVVVVNYDKAHDLRGKYLVSYQHTFVQIDEHGNKLAIWNGGGVDGILKNTIRQEEN